MARARIDDGAGVAAVRAALAAGAQASREIRAQAVRYSLQLLAEQAEGNTVEVRVPPFGAVQCVAGPRHTRGTPPNVVETDAVTWLNLATGALSWQAGVLSGAIHASGQRADLTGHVPVLPL
ncbi:MAG: sterol carrier family protein [Cryobacterium sp.]